MAVTYPHRRNLSACGGRIRAGARYRGPRGSLELDPGVVGVAMIFHLLAVGFCAMRRALTACRRRVAPLHGAIPPDRWS